MPVICEFIDACRDRFGVAQVCLQQAGRHPAGTTWRDCGKSIKVATGQGGRR